MKQRALFSWLTGSFITLCGSVAQADPRIGDDHFEATMGFLASGMDHSHSDFSGGASVNALRQAPYDNLQAFGLRYDLRLVVEHVRMMAGVDLPFASVSSLEGAGDGARTVSARGMHLFTGRFGIGAEYPIGSSLAPYLDLVGSIHSASVSVAVDGRDETYNSLGFGFSVRSGIRAELRRWFFVSASGEIGVVGPTRWGADLSVGFRIH